LARAAIAVLAFSGNALVAQDPSGSHREQVRMARKAARSVVTLMREGYRVLVIHGGEPQVGRELVRNEESSTRLPPLPLDACIANVQGSSGYLLEVEIRNELKRLQAEKHVSTVITQTLVGLDDPAFQQPLRAIGPTVTEWRARTLSRASDVRLVEEAGKGWRRVVPSPRPLEIVNLGTIEALLEANHIVIAAGGGGVPVAVDARGQLIGVEALIDKDRTAALLGIDLGAELLVLLTSVDQLYTNFGRVDQRPVERVTTSELRALHRDGHFPTASIGTKVDAVLEFMDDGGTSAIITSADQFAAALSDRGGTRISRQTDDGPVIRQIPLFDFDGGLN
jgi:carbamate kinase